MRSKPAPLLTLAASFCAACHVDAGRDLLDQRDDVAHAQDAAGVALGIEHLQAVDLLADAGELDRRAGDLAHRQRRAAARIAVQSWSG